MNVALLNYPSQNYALLMVSQYICNFRNAFMTTGLEIDFENTLRMETLADKVKLTINKFKNEKFRW